MTYHLKEIYDWEMFNIHRETGLIRTTHVFDRERKSEYYIMVVAEDDAPSDRPNHRPVGTPNRGKWWHHRAISSPEAREGLQFFCHLSSLTSVKLEKIDIYAQIYKKISFFARILGKIIFFRCFAPEAREKFTFCS